MLEMAVCVLGTLIIGVGGRWNRSRFPRPRSFAEVLEVAPEDLSVRFGLALFFGYGYHWTARRESFGWARSNLPRCCFVWHGFRNRTSHP